MTKTKNTNKKRLEEQAKNLKLSNGMTLFQVAKKWEEDDKIEKEFKAKGAKIKGTRTIDKEYKKHLEDSIKLILNLKKDEAMAVAGYQIRMNPKAWGMDKMQKK
jgi:hypothetical protein